MSIHQYDKPKLNRHQPPEAKTKEVVAIRLIIGVIVISIPYPMTNPANPASISPFTFSDSGLSESSNLPASTPQIVCAAVGMQLIATQPPRFTLFIRSKSTKFPKLCWSVNG